MNLNQYLLLLLHFNIFKLSFILARYLIYMNTWKLRTFYLTYNFLTPGFKYAKILLVHLLYLKYFLKWRKPGILLFLKLSITKLNKFIIRVKADFRTYDILLSVCANTNRVSNQFDNDIHAHFSLINFFI